VAINLVALPSLTPPITWDTIPIGIDPVPYNQLLAQGRYTKQAIPDEFPWMFASLAASDPGFNADLLSTDGKRNLNVNVKAGGGGTLVAPGGAANAVRQSTTFEGIITGAGTAHLAISQLSTYVAGVMGSVWCTAGTFNGGQFNIRAYITGSQPAVLQLFRCAATQAPAQFDVNRALYPWCTLASIIGGGSGFVDITTSGGTWQYSFDLYSFD
jgi:hypothetical protein